MSETSAKPQTNVDDSTEFEEISELCREFYKSKCQQYGVIPHRKVLHMLGTTRLDVKFMNIGPTGGLAVVDALKNNTITEYVDLSGNGLECRAVCLLMSSLNLNAFITELNLSGNSLTLECARKIGKYLNSNGGLINLNLSENRFTDTEVHYLVEGMKKNTHLKELKISKNKIGSAGITDFGDLLVINESLKLLDISWNEIRGDAAYYFGLCMSKNRGLISLDISWNGLAEDGSLGFERCLSNNVILEELNVKSNRINFESLYRLGKGLRRNRTLKILKIGLNNLTLAGILDLMDAANSAESGLEYVDLEGQYVHSKVLYLIEKINRLRPFHVAYEKVLDLEDEIYNAMEKIGKTENEDQLKSLEPKDPMEFLLEYLSDRAIRVVDFFRMIDKDGMGEVSRSKFIRNMKKNRVPLTSNEMQHVTSMIDENKSGMISYSKLIQKLRGYQKVVREKELSKRLTKDQKQEKIVIKAHIARLFEAGQFESPKFISTTSSATTRRDNVLPPIPKLIHKNNYNNKKVIIYSRSKSLKDERISTLVKIYPN